MINEQFREGMGILEAAFRKKYSDQSVALFWAELQDRNGSGFLISCRQLARSAPRLPSLSEIFNVLPAELEEKSMTTEGNLWLDKIREIYNRFVGLSVPERIALRGRFNAEEEGLMQEAVVLYEKIWPEVCRVCPDWTLEQKAQECLKRYIGKRHRDATPEEMTAGVVGYDGKVYKWPLWYARRYWPEVLERVVANRET